MRHHRWISISVIALSIILVPALAATRDGLSENPQVQQLIQSGQVTSGEVKQGVEALKSGRPIPEKIRQLSDKMEQGTLTPAEIEAGRRALDDKRKSGATEQKDIGSEKEKEKPLNDKVTDRGSSISAQATFLKRIFGADFSGLSLYGHTLFRKTSELAEPIKNTPVSNEYLIGPGDAINILMWGRMDASYTLEVDNEGVIYFPKIGPLTVAGLTYQETKELITRKAEAITGVNVSISMGRLRTMQIFVLGEVARPGIHTVSSLATAVNALLAASGPSLHGSLRKVQVKRQGRTITTIDLYDFLQQGDISKDSRLMPADIIFVPQAETLVAITGNVRKPAVYELQYKERTLRAAIDLGGGLAPRAYKQRVQIKRAAENQAEIILDIPFAELQKHEQIPLQDGDSIRIFSILPSATNAVQLYGNVLRPGQYAYKKGLALRDLIPGIESLQADTYFEYALIKRYHFEDMSTELIPFDLNLLLSETFGANLSLLPLDEVYIFNKWRFADKPTATIRGEVRKPGNYEIDTMRIRDLIFKADGLTNDAFMDTGHLYRTDQQTKKVTIHTFNMAAVLAEDPEHNLQLQDLDEIVAHSIWEYTEKHTVSANGEVNNPGKYPYADNMTVRDLILLAGNIKESAYLENAELIRYNIVEGKKVQTTLVSFDVTLALAEDPSHDINLQPFDIIHIKQIPAWGESEDVSIGGEVLFPGTYSVRKDERLSSIINRAGGYTAEAYFRGAVFTRESVRLLQQSRLEELTNRLSKELAQIATSEFAGTIDKEDLEGNKALMSAQESLINRLRSVKANGRVVIKLVPGPAFETSSFNLILENRDRIFIPPKPDTVSVSGEVYNSASLIYNPEKPELSHYLARTGGPTKYANAKEMFILQADGTVLSKGNSKAWISSFEDTPLYPGDTLVVPPKLIHTRLKREIQDITSIIYQMAVSAGIIINQVFR